MHFELLVEEISSGEKSTSDTFSMDTPIPINIIRTAILSHPPLLWLLSDRSRPRRPPPTRSAALRSSKFSVRKFDRRVGRSWSGLI
jgi:hypothetical protein